PIEGVRWAPDLRSARAPRPGRGARRLTHSACYPDALIPPVAGESVMASTVRSPRALTHTARWSQPDSKSAALFARAQGVLPGGNSRTTAHTRADPPHAH